LVNVFYNPGTNGAKFDYGYRGTPIIIELGFDASKDMHQYTIEWDPCEIRWFVDRKVVHPSRDLGSDSDPSPTYDIAREYGLVIAAGGGSVKAASSPPALWVMLSSKKVLKSWRRISVW
jgi:beta-glucanase (GH16 family)